MLALKRLFETTQTATSPSICSHCHSAIEAGHAIYAAAQWGTVRHAEMDTCRAGAEAHAALESAALLASLHASDARRGPVPSQGYVAGEGEDGFYGETAQGQDVYGGEG